MFGHHSYMHKGVAFNVGDKVQVLKSGNSDDGRIGKIVAVKAGGLNIRFRDPESLTVNYSIWHPGSLRLVK